MPHVLVAGKLHEDGLALLRQAEGFSFDYVPNVVVEDYVALLDRADALLIRTQPVTEEILVGAARLKIVSRHGVGYDAIDVAALEARGIPLVIVGDVNSRTVAEHAMMLMLAASKRLLRSDRAARGGDWEYRNSLEPRELSGKRLLIVGFGRIGRRLSVMAQAFGMTVEAYDPFLQPDQLDAAEVTLVPDLRAALRDADVVSAHLPPPDRPVFGKAEFAAMKPTAIFINTARGSVVDEAALVAALQDGLIAAAGLDVYASEPPSPDNPLFTLDNVVLTPHSAGLTEECAARMAAAAAQNILDFFAGRLDRRLVVNPAACSAGT